MPDQEMGPDSLVPKGLPSARRGYDHHAVEQLLRRAREAWAALQEQHRRLLAEIDRAGGLEYLARDLGSVGGDVGRLLADAQEASRGLRERARSDSAARLAAAVVEARRLVAEAEAQSFHLRADAWTAAEGLLHDAEEAHRVGLAAADAEVLLIRAEAEQEAYRLVATAKREAQDITRGARFEAERTVLEIRAQPERILPVEVEPVVESAPPTEPAAGRARRRRGPVPPEPTREDVIRVIQPPGARRPAEAGLDPASYGDAMAAEVEALRVTDEVEAVRVEPAPAPAPAAPTTPGPEPEEASPPTGEVEWAEAAPAEAAPEELAEETAPSEAAAVPVAPAVEELEAPVPAVEPAATTVPQPPAPRHPHLDDLFSRLRRSAPAADRPAAVAAPIAEQVAAPRSATPRPDPLDLRERLLLPVQNRALRRVKEGIVELQNVALDSLRVTGSWEGLSAAEATLEAALDPVTEEGAEAGAAAAGAFTGGEGTAPVITARSGTLVRAMASDLAGQVKAAVAGGSGAGPLEVAAAVARVFRAWRSDEAERWVRAVAYAAYHDSLLAGLAVSGVGSVAPVAAGLLCAECPAGRGEAWDPAGHPPAGTRRPPARPDCICTVAPA
jgi:cell division septum initiation protein DivIVA